MHNVQMWVVGVYVLECILTCSVLSRSQCMINRSLDESSAVGSLSMRLDSGILWSLLNPIRGPKKLIKQAVGLSLETITKLHKWTGSTPCQTTDQHWDPDFIILVTVSFVKDLRFNSFCKDGLYQRDSLSKNTNVANETSKKKRRAISFH